MKHTHYSFPIGVPPSVWSHVEASGRIRFCSAEARLPKLIDPTSIQRANFREYINEFVRNNLDVPSFDFVEFLSRTLPDAVIAGGSLLRCALHARHGATFDAQDIDVWVSGASGESSLEAISVAAKALLSLAPHATVEFTLGTISVHVGDVKVQFVYTDRAYTATEIIDTFDISCCQIALRVRTGEVLVSESFVRTLVDGDVRIEDMPYITRSLTRVKKYVDRGFTFSMPAVRGLENVSLDFHVLAALCLGIEGSEHERRIGDSILAVGTVRDVCSNHSANAATKFMGLCSTPASVPLIAPTIEGNLARAVLVDHDLRGIVCKRPFLGKFGDPYVGFGQYERPLRISATNARVSGLKISARLGRDGRAYRVSVHIPSAMDSFERAEIVNHFLGLTPWSRLHDLGEFAMPRVVLNACTELRVGEQCWMPRPSGYPDSMTGRRLVPHLRAAVSSALPPQPKKSRACGRGCCGWMFFRGWFASSTKGGNYQRLPSGAP